MTNPLIKQMKLVDVDNNKEIQAIRDGHIMKYTFNMNGSDTHAFEWVVETSEVSIALPPVPDKDTSVTPSASRSASRTVINSEPRRVKPKSFDLSKPTMPRFN